MNLKEAAQAAKGELWQLASIELEKAKVEDRAFSKTEKVDGKDVTRVVNYKVIVIDGKEFNIREKQLNQLKELIEKSPACKRVRLMKFDDGKLAWIVLE